MLSFRVEDDEAASVQQWADRLGVARSHLLREALHRHLTQLQAEDDVHVWNSNPATAAERSLADVADWGPAEDWSDWSDETR
jgi:predicted transcriptional regulator